MTKQVPLSRVAFLHKCPACGKGSIYNGLLKVVNKCKVCKLSLGEHDAGDGPAFFSMFASGVIVTLLAVFAEYYFAMPLWLHMLLWTPLIIVNSIYFLIVTKSFLIGVQYKNNVHGFRKKKRKK